MSTGLQRVEAPSTTVTQYVDPLAQFEQVKKLAEEVSKSQIGRLTPPQALTLMLLAQARGFPMIEGPMRYHFFQGQVVMKAHAILAEFQQAGGRVEWKKDTDTECEAVFSHPIHQKEGKTSSFTIEEAKRAGLTGKDVWKSWPRNMLRARVISNGVGMVMPGVMNGIMVQEVAEDVEFRVADTSARDAIIDKLKAKTGAAPAKPVEPDYVDATVEPSPTPVAATPATPVAPVPPVVLTPEPAPPPRQPQSPWGKWISDVVSKYNVQLVALAELNPTNDKLKKKLSVTQVVNHLIKDAIESGDVTKDEIETNGKRDPAKISGIITEAWDTDETDVQNAVNDYIAELLTEANPEVIKKDWPVYDPETDNQAQS
jgi:hypothetical protein